MEMLNLSPQMLAPHSWKLKTPLNSSPSRFICPPKDFLKLNYDGAS